METDSVPAEGVAPAPVSAVFPDAPPDARPPESTSELFKAELRDFRERHPSLPWVWAVGQFIAPVALFLVLGRPEPAAVVAVVFLAIAFVFIGVQWKDAEKLFWRLYAKSRGLQIDDERPRLNAHTPLMRMGDKRKVSRTLRGRIGTGTGVIAQYTYTEITYTRDSNGNRQKQEQDFDFTLVVYQLPQAVADRFRGVYCRKKAFSLGALQDALSHDRGVSLESVEFNDRYSLRVVNDQDDIALYELFSTTFIHELATGAFIEWEQVGDDLVLYRKGHTTSVEELDGMCAAAARVHQRYCEEYM